jgi:ATP-dependent DNA helicase RecG
MWEYIKKRSEVGEQTFVVCPRIEDEDDELVSAAALYKQKKTDFGDSIALLHGKLKEETKAAIMRDFAQGKTKVLISTTVVEVGIDVKNATTMVIYNAERFGLSQLHQLRGRVGRGEKDGYCFVLTAVDTDSVRERLSFFVNCSDGFELAEYDFSVRGGGDFIGTGQHGKSGDFAMSMENIVCAKQISDELLKDESYRRAIEETVNENRFEYFKSITLN